MAARLLTQARPSTQDKEARTGKPSRPIKPTGRLQLPRAHTLGDAGDDGRERAAAAAAAENAAPDKRRQLLHLLAASGERLRCEMRARNLAARERGPTEAPPALARRPRAN